MTHLDPDPRRGLFLARNVIIGVIVAAAGLTMIAVWFATTMTAEGYIDKNYQRTASLDEPGEKAYIADGSPRTVAAAIADAEEPIDARDGAAGTTGLSDGSHFMQYSDGLIALFPYQTDKTRVMVAKDYTTGYNHYRSYVGHYWISTPRFSGSGSQNRGGGSGSGK